MQKFRLVEIRIKGRFPVGVKSRAGNNSIAKKLNWSQLFRSTFCVNQYDIVREENSACVSQAFYYFSSLEKNFKKHEVNGNDGIL